MARRRRTPRPGPPGSELADTAMNQKLNAMNKKLNVTNKKPIAPSGKPSKRLGSRTNHGPPHPRFALSPVLTALATLPVLCSPIVLLFCGFGAFFRVLTMPIRIPWKIVMWCPEMTMMVVMNYQPFLLFLTCAVTLGALSGVFTGVVTLVFARILPFICPCLRRRRERKRLQRAATNQPPKRHAASALTWSSDESGGVPGPLIPPPRRFHGKATKAKAPPTAKAPPDAMAATGLAGTAAWMRDSFNRGRQQVQDRMDETIHEESSMSDDRPRRYL